VGNQDEDYKTIMKCIRSGWEGDLTEEVKRAKVNAHSLNIVDNLVLMNSRLYVPLSMRQDILSKLHAGHQGIVKTSRRGRESVWLPSMNREIKEMVSSCNMCIKNQRMSHKPLTTSDLPEGPWEELGTDLFEF
jgi:hypothetical protein